jgi:hypothetical protein
MRRSFTLVEKSTKNVTFNEVIEVQYATSYYKSVTFDDLVEVFCIPSRIIDPPDMCFPEIVKKNKKVNTHDIFQKRTAWIRSICKQRNEANEAGYAVGTYDSMIHIK